MAPPQDFIKAIRRRSSIERLFQRAIEQYLADEFKNTRRAARAGRVYEASPAGLARIMDTYMVQAAIIGMGDGLEPLIAMGLGFDTALMNEAAVAFARDYISSAYDVGLTEAITTHTQAVIQRETSKWLASGDKLDELMTALEPTFGRKRAQTIAVTEVTNAIAGGNLAAWKEANRQLGTEIVSGSSWRTANDENVCFPAWTMVETEEGEVRIADIKPGNMVFTSYGLCPVKAVGRRIYLGSMISITAGKNWLVATDKHPVSVAGKGWMPMNELELNDVLYVSSDDRGFVYPLEEVEISSITSTHALMMVYNLEMEEYPEFFANGILVHNCPICAPLGGLTFVDGASQPASINTQERRGVTAGLSDVFVHPGGKGAAGKFDGKTFERPPAHARCRCSLSPMIVEVKK